MTDVSWCITFTWATLLAQHTFYLLFSCYHTHSNVNVNVAADFTVFPSDCCNYAILTLYPFHESHKIICKFRWAEGPIKVSCLTKHLFSKWKLNLCHKTSEVWKVRWRYRETRAVRNGIVFTATKHVMCVLFSTKMSLPVLFLCARWTSQVATYLA
jgi:hypothetical protein